MRGDLKGLVQQVLTDHPGEDLTIGRILDLTGIENNKRGAVAHLLGIMVRDGHVTQVRESRPMTWKSANPWVCCKEQEQRKGWK